MCWAGLRAGPEPRGATGCDDAGVQVSSAVRARAGPAVAWVLLGLSVGLTGLAVAFARADGPVPGGDLVLDCVLAVGCGLLGAFIVTRHPTHGVGWLFVITGFLRGVTAGAQTWAQHALMVRAGSLPAGPLASWLALAFLPTVAAAPMIVVLFPDGHLPGRTWRVIPTLAAAAAVLLGAVVPALAWPYRGRSLLPDAPVPDSAAGRTAQAALDIGVAVTLLAVVLALGSLLVRARRERADARQQVKWFGFGVVAAFALDLAGLIPGLAWIRAVGPVAVLAGIGLGIFRYRLYDVDRLINRTLVYALLTVTLVAMFAAVDVTLALIVGHGSVAVAAVSAFAVALLLRPVRDRVQSLIDRVFDRRAHEAVRVLREMSYRVGHEQARTGAVRDALGRALRDPMLEVYFAVGQPRMLVDSFGTAADPSPADGKPRIDQVRQSGETIAVVVHSGRDARLVHKVLNAATPLLEHARLRAELSIQLAEVRASRARLALAADSERRRIERDLHDGAQQRLVGLALHIQSARRRTEYPPDVDVLLGFTVDQLQAGVDDIRVLVRGLLPPALTTGGLPAALNDLARPGEVTVTCHVPERPPPSIEATAWFIACEGVANARKHAAGAEIDVDVSSVNGRLLVRVTDSGPGGADPQGQGLRHLADRVEAHGGVLHLDSPPGGGTRLVAELPCAS